MIDADKRTGNATPSKSWGPAWALCGALVGAGVSALTFYFGPYSEMVRTQRQELASDLAAYYSEAAAEYYASNDVALADERHIDRGSPYYLQIQKEDDTRYAALFSATTKLATEVPCELRSRVLVIEDCFERIPNHATPRDEKKYFQQLDALRDEILDKTKFDQLLSPIWK